MQWTIGIIASLIALFFGSITDLKTREVPDWVSHGLIYFGFALNIMLSIIFNTWAFILISIGGFIFTFLLGLAMYKLGQWGGGDSKMIMGIGSTMGLDPQNLFLVTFMINTVLVGTVYGIFWSVVVAIKNKKIFIKDYREFIITKPILLIRLLLYVVVIAGLLAAFIFMPTAKLEIVGAAALIFFLAHAWIFLKVVEKSCMIQTIPLSRVTIGDWIVENIRIKGKLIAGPKDLGISKEQISKLKSLKVKTVKVKYGVPFVPSFLIAFILSILLGAWYLTFLLA